MATETKSRNRKSCKALLGKKIGMTQLFDDDGTWVPVTVLQAGPCTVLQVKSEDNDGYSAVQLGFDDRRKEAKRPQQVYYDRIGATQKYLVREVPFVDPADVLGAGSSDGNGDGPSSDGDGDDEGGGDASGGDGEGAGDAGAEGRVVPGAVIGVGVFKGISRVDVRGVTKGRGFSGTIKRHNFSAGDKGHGSKNVREPGSTGMHTDPGRVNKGKKMPGHYGAANRKIQNLAVVRIDEERNLLLVKGAVPGPRGGYVYIEESLKQGS